MVDKYEDPFVKISAMIGGDEYLKVSRSLLKSEDATDEEIASSTGLRINMVRKVLYDLFGKGLITGVRVKDEQGVYGHPHTVACHRCAGPCRAMTP